MKRTTGINQEFIICRYLNGIKLLPQESIKSGKSPELKIKPIKSVSDFMQMPFNVFFFGSDFSVKDFNESCAVSYSIYSKSDIVGHTVEKITNNKHEINKLYVNNKSVMENAQLSIVNEGISLPDNEGGRAVSYKMPWYDENGGVLGVFGCAATILREKLTSIADDLVTISNMFLTPQIPSTKNLLKDMAIIGEHFTPREIDVIHWATRGKTMREIGLMLGVTTKTVEGYFADAKMKVGVRTKSQLIERVMRKSEWL